MFDGAGVPSWDAGDGHDGAGVPSWVGFTREGGWGVREMAMAMAMA